MKSIVFINVLRYTALSLSLIGFACHFAQCALLSEYQKRTDIRSWIKAGHWQYLAWFVTFGLSILSALAICAHATCCNRAHIMRGDKCLGIFNIVPFVGAILGNTFSGSQEPWTDGIVEFKAPARGFIAYCGMLDKENDASYPILLQRCILLDSTYVLAVATCLSWIMLVLSAIFLKQKKSSAVKLADENGWNISERKRSQLLNNGNYDPYVKKHSTSFDPPYLYPTAEKSAYYKYATPIAPHIEKVQLPESYNNHKMDVLNADPSTLSRHHYSEDIAEGWIYSAPLTASSPYYQADNNGHSSLENRWYPNVVNSRAI